MRCALAFLGCLIFGGIAVTGCGRTNGLLSSAGFANASDVSFVLLGDGHTYKVSDAATIRQLHYAVNKPDRNWITRMARCNPIAFVAEDGRVAYLMCSDVGDLTATQGSDKLMRVLDQVFHNPAYRDTSHVPIGRLTEVRLHSPKGVTAVSPGSGVEWSKVHTPLVALLESWPSDELRGSIRCSRKEVDDTSKQAYRYIELDFAQPSAFKTLIVPKDLAQRLPPETVETRARYEEVRYDRVRIINTRLGVKAKHEIKLGEVRLAFGAKTGDTWVLTNVIGTRRFLGYSPNVMSRYGPDLLDEAVSALAKP